MVALGFFLFGATDATTRIMPAIFGTILIAMCWVMRPYIGRLGALAAATIVTFSPSIMYYSRSLRHDMFATGRHLHALPGASSASCARTRAASSSWAPWAWASRCAAMN